MGSRLGAAWLGALVLSGAAAAARAEGGPAAGGAAEGIAWLRDFEAGKAQAAREGKVLVVYVAPGFYENPFCGKMEQEVFTDPGFRKWTRDHVFVRVDDPRDAAAQFRQARGLPPGDWPYTALFDPGGELIGTVTRYAGFPSAEGYREALKKGIDRGRRLSAARAAAAKDPAALSEVACIVAEMPERCRDALALLAKVPEDRKDAKVRAVERAVRGKIAWEGVLEGMRARIAELQDGADPEDEVATRAINAKLAAEGLVKVEAWLKEFGPESSLAGPKVLVSKTNYHLTLGQKEKAIETLRVLLEKHPDCSVAEWARTTIPRLQKEVEKEKAAAEKK